MKHIYGLLIMLTSLLAACATASQSTWDTSYGGVDKSYDSELLRMREQIAPRFQTLTFHDAVTGKTMIYSLFIPAGYDPKISYPLVMFMGDGSTTGKGPLSPLMQGYGGIIWATDESQANHPCFVLVPSYVGPENVVNDNWETSDEVDMTQRLLESVVSGYNIDRNRLYTTGQSMGGMMSFYFNANHPDLFAASLFVGSQWDIKVLEPLARKKFFYIVSAGDQKASGGMREVGEMLTGQGVNYGSTEFSAKLPDSDKEQRIASLLAQGHDINFVRFSAGTVVPEGDHGPGGEHMYSFDYAYKLEAVRDWLFQQTRDSSAVQLYRQGEAFRDTPQAFAFFLQAAELGYGPAQSRVGDAYQYGRGVAQDYAQALVWHEKAIEQGVGRSMLDLGIMYFSGSGVVQDYDKAIELFTLAWKRGDMKAPRYLGIMQEEGLGVSVNYAEALRLYKEASAAGDITAAARIGALYERGWGVAQSWEQALHWYLIAAPSPEEAAKNVHPRILALLRLGFFYEKGLGVAEDTVKALAWYRVAAQDNDPTAIAAVERLTSAQAK